MRTPLREQLRSAPTRIYVTAMNRALHAFARVRYAMPDARPSRFHLRLERDVVYGSRDVPEHRLDAYIPTRGHGPTPVVMYVHGGGFRMLSKETHRVMALAIARAGYLLFNINYRQGTRHPYPAPLEDASRALLWVQENCARYGGDPGRIALAGESAGGNLVTALAVASSWRRPEPFARRVFDAHVALRAVVATYGFLDLGHTDEYLKHPRMSRWTKSLLLDAARSYVGYDVRSAVEAFPLTSPLRIIEGGAPDRPLPPFFASVGTATTRSSGVPRRAPSGSPSIPSSTARWPRPAGTTRRTYAPPCSKHDLGMMPMTERAAENSTALTEGVRVSVRSQYVADQSVPLAQRYVFAYTVRIANEGLEPAQLRTRHWVITDGAGKVEEVRGPGVVGQTPFLRPGEHFEYTSGCILQTSRGEMRGTYQMYRPDGRMFDALIAPFLLALPHSLN